MQEMIDSWSKEEDGEQILRQQAACEEYETIVMPGFTHGPMPMPWDQNPANPLIEHKRHCERNKRCRCGLLRKKR